jgi:hypothetical protein
MVSARIEDFELADVWIAPRPKGLLGGETFLSLVSMPYVPRYLKI